MRFLVFYFLSFYFNNLFSQIVYRDPAENLKINSNVYYFEDKRNLLSIGNVVEKDSFILGNKKVANFGVTSSSLWFRISIKNATQINELILQVNQPIIDEIEFYSYDSIKNYFEVLKMGETHPFKFRKYFTPEYLFDLNIPTNHIKTIYLKIRCKENMQVPLILGTSLSLFNQTVLSNIAGGIYLGIMLVMILYNLFIFRIFRDNSYILYSLYIVLTMLTQASLQGYTFQLLWPNSPWMAIYSPFLFPALVSIFGLEFFKQFLRIKERNRVAYNFSFYFFIPYGCSIILSFLGFYSVSFMMMEVTSTIVSIFMLYVAYNIYKKGFSEARFFLIGWSIFLIGICIYVLKDFEILPYNAFTRYTMQIGSAIETILLSFALADRINILKKEKEESQATTLDALKENEKLIIEQNVVLERNVEQRTIELKTTLNNLKDTQAQLVNAEKMASLGQLTAGIAHEINNPINFVSSNVKPLRLDIDEILELLNKYELLVSQEIAGDKLKDIEKFKKDIGIDYLKQEMAQLLSGIEDGAKRTADIVSGLKNFSRLDESDIKEVNINDGIKSTLILLKSAIPEKTEVIMDLGDIPMIECLPGKLNQVFMNLFSNALYAISKKANEDINRLTIKTYTFAEQVFVSVTDTGIGMTPDVKAKLFDPFFTTKDVGEGTGLGMSIVFKIIESHGAKIEVESEYGIGTKILLILNKKITP